MHYLRLLVFLLLADLASAQEVRIAEFQTINTNGIRDEDGTTQPWIELWNASTTVKTPLTGWSLTDGTTTWNIPAVEMVPGERLVIWASGKNRTVVTAQLHTNFTLPAGGGTLSLKQGVTNRSRFVAYPAQVANTSWGRDQADSAVDAVVMGKYTNPTPGEANNYSGSGVSGNVLISEPSRAFSGTMTVTLAQETPVAGAVIRYTVNGAVPIATSTLFNVGTPISVAATTLLRARVFEPGKLPGETDASGYLRLDATTTGFNTAAPIIVVSTFGLAIPDTGDQPAFMWVWEPGADLRARFLNAGVPVLPTLATRCAVDKRGSSTLNNAKTNFNLEVRKERDDVDKDVSLLGMPDGSDWVFHAPFAFDPSLLHNPLAYAMSNSIGRQAMRTRMAEVFVETTSGTLVLGAGASGDYFGIYNVMEKIRRGKDRVDIEKLDTYDNDPVNKTGGYIFKVDRQDSGDTGFTAGGATLAYYYPKEIEIKSPQRDPQEVALTSYINSFKTALDSATYTNPTTGYAAWLDVPEAIDHHLLNVWAFNVDALRLSGYLHKERGGKILFGPVWDFDRALSSTDGRDANPAVWRSQTADQGTDFFNYAPWWPRLFSDANFYQKYIDRWVELRRGAYSPTAVNALIDSLNAQLTAEGVARDLARWGQAKRAWMRPFPAPNNNTIPASQAAEVQRLKDYLQQRANFFETQWVKPVTLSNAGGNIAPGLILSMTTEAGATIRYTLDGSDPRPSGGGAAAAGVLTYTAPITINATTRVRARAYWTAKPGVLTGPNNPPLRSSWSGLADARFSTDTPAEAVNLAVTELSYHPANPTPAELVINPLFASSDFEFIELKNIGATVIDLGGLQVTLGVTFTVTNDLALTLAPGAFVIIAANPAALAARYGALANVVGPFAGDLSDAGEQIVIKSLAGATIADFTYDDEWHSSTDGPGNTLAIFDPMAAAAAFSDSANWRASAAVGGSPGADEPNRAPVVIPGPSASGDLTGIALTATKADDRQPNFPGMLTYAWSLSGGPGNAIFTPGNELLTTASFTLPGIYIARLTANDGSLSGFADITVFAKDTPPAWLARHPGIGTLDDDFDLDGWNNFTEFSLGLDAELPDVNARPVTVLENGHLTMTFSRIKPPASVIYAIEVADDPTAFRAPNPGEVTEQILADNGITQTVKMVDTASTAGPATRYIRLKIRPAP